MLTGLLALPSTALMLHEVAHGGEPAVQLLRDRVTGPVRELAGAEVLVLAADALADPVPVQPVPASGAVTLSGLGLPTASAPVSPARIAGIPVLDVHPGPDLAVLAVLASRSGARTVSLVALPPACEDEALRELSGAILQLAQTIDLAVVVAGDLAAGHGPKPPRPDVGEARSGAFDAEVLAALDDPGTLEGQDSTHALREDARATAARGLPGILLALRLAAALDLAPQMPMVDIVGGVSSLSCVWTNASP